MVSTSLEANTPDPVHDAKTEDQDRLALLIADLQKTLPEKEMVSNNVFKSPLNDMSTNPGKPTEETHLDATSGDETWSPTKKTSSHSATHQKTAETQIVAVESSFAALQTETDEEEDDKMEEQEESHTTTTDNEKSGDMADKTNPAASFQQKMKREDNQTQKNSRQSERTMSNAAKKKQPASLGRR